MTTKLVERLSGSEAALARDTGRRSRPSGARSVPSDHLRLLYHAGVIAIDLEVVDSPTAGRLRLLGQVTAEQADLAQAWVAVEGTDGRVETQVDELGQFILDELTPGCLRMEIGLANGRIDIPEIQI